MLRAIVFAVLLVSAAAYAAEMAGDYTGTWSSNNGGDGKLHVAIAKAADGWSCKLSYSIADQPKIIAQRVSCAVDGTLLEGQYEVDADGGTARIAFEAVSTGTSLEGTYSETGPDGKPADSGKWKVAAAH